MDRRNFIGKFGTKASVAIAAGATLAHSAIDDAIAKVRADAAQAALVANRQFQTMTARIAQLDAKVSALEAKQILTFAWLVALSIYTGFDWLSVAGSVSVI